jgi:hypothetical protein
MITSNCFAIINKKTKKYATRINGNTKTVIDHVITDIRKFKYKIFVDSTSLSDHNLIGINIKTNVPLNDYREIDKINFNKCKSDLRELINNIDSCDDLNHVLMETCKKNKYTIKQSTRANNKWFNKEIENAIKLKEFLYKRQKIYPNNQNIKKQYKKQKT